MATYVGTAIPSTTNGRLAAGAGTYVADVTPAGCLHMALVRSPHARAAVLAIDTERAAEGATVITGAQLGLGPLPLSYIPEAVGVQAPRTPVLAIDRVRYAGEPVVTRSRSRSRASDASPTGSSRASIRFRSAERGRHAEGNAMRLVDLSAPIMPDAPETPQPFRDSQETAGRL